MRTGKEINDLYAHVVEPKLCGTCGNSTKDDVCMIWDTGLKVTEAGTCSGWQPIPVATTNAQNMLFRHTGQKPDEYPSKQETEDAYVYLVKKGLVVDQKYHGYMLAMHEAISKRDDLIRRMFEWIITYTYLTPHDTGARQYYDVLCEDARELMGVK